MLRLVIKDFFQSINRASLKSILLGITYFGILGQFVSGSNIRGTVALTIMILPFCVVIVRNTPRYMDKAVYMCPMSKEERKHFILYSYLSRVTMYMFLTVLCLLVGSFITDINKWIACIYLVNSLTLVLSLHQKIDGGYIITYSADKQIKNYDISSAIAIFLAYVNYAICISIFENTKEKDYMILIIFTAVWAFTQLPLAIRSVCKMKGIINRAAEYKGIQV